MLAEGAKINEGLRSAINTPSSVMSSAAPFQSGLSSENADLRDLLDATPDEITERQRDAALDLAATQKAAAILRKGGPNAYAKALRALRQDSREWWDDNVADEEHPATAEGLPPTSASIRRTSSTSSSSMSVTVAARTTRATGAAS